MEDSVRSAEVAESARLTGFHAALSLPGDERDCTAWDKNAREGMFNVREFNRGVEYGVPPEGWNTSGMPQRNAWIRETRESLVRGRVREKFILTKVRDPTLSRKLDSEVVVRMRMDILSQRRKYGDGALRAMYRGALASMFREKAEMDFRVVASTDSLFIDSIFRNLEASRSQSRTRRIGVGIPWQKCDEDCTSRIPAKTTDSLAIGEWTSPNMHPIRLAHTLLPESCRRILEVDSRTGDSLTLATEYGQWAFNIISVKPRAGTAASSTWPSSKTRRSGSRPRTMPPSRIHQGCRLIGDGLYGVDIKVVGNKPYVMEVNDNPNIDVRVEDEVLKDTLYNTIMKEFANRPLFPEPQLVLICMKGRNRIPSAISCARLRRQTSRMETALPQ